MPFCNSNPSVKIVAATYYYCYIMLSANTLPAFSFSQMKRFSCVVYKKWPFAWMQMAIRFYILITD